MVHNLSCQLLFRAVLQSEIVGEAARDAARDVAHDAAHDAVHDAAPDVANNAARDAHDAAREAPTCECCSATSLAQPVMSVSTSNVRICAQFGCARRLAAYLQKCSSRAAVVL